MQDFLLNQGLFIASVALGAKWAVPRLEEAFRAHLGLIRTLEETQRELVTEIKRERCAVCAHKAEERSRG